MEKLVANDNGDKASKYDFDLIAQVQGFSSYTSYLDEVYGGDLEEHPAETMVYSTDEELEVYLKSGTYEERRYARIEKCDRTLNISLEDIAGRKKESHDPELEAVICELESSWTRGK